jgi:transcriptional activator of cad operon
MTTLRIGDWHIDPASSEISRNGETARLEIRTMRLLMYLAERAGEIVSIDELLRHVWPDVAVTPDSVYQAVTSLRRALGDDPKQPAYIATVPRLGYRMIAAVSFATLSSQTASAAEQSEVSPPQDPAHRSWKAPLMWAIAAALGVLLIFTAVHFRRTIAGSHPAAASTVIPPPQKSIAVLPFLDLTEGMKNGEFADGMTEELIDELSKVPDFRVPAPTASFYFKDKQLPVADIAGKLGVAYVLDGSVRKSGGRLRVAARLIRADNSYIIWTENYDRPVGDILMIQDDIATSVTKALQTSIDGKVQPRSTPN